MRIKNKQKVLLWQTGQGQYTHLPNSWIGILKNGNVKYNESFGQPYYSLQQSMYKTEKRNNLSQSHNVWNFFKCHINQLFIRSRRKHCVCLCNNRSKSELELNMACYPGVFYQCYILLFMSLSEHAKPFVCLKWTKHCWQTSIPGQCRR